DDPASDTAPQDFALLQNYPNPFNPTTTIPVKLATSADIRLTIFDNLGRTVRNLVDGNVSAGSHDFEWNGRNNRGEAVASGTYFYRLDINGQQSRSQMNKMMLSR
ncbi:MAG: T9SS type A sorting domain-containing protein, partial [Calditrichaeota bacterium]|nr:T9SS type A sorting domain-containing protein [Calditrichota bacterium]